MTIEVISTKTALQQYRKDRSEWTNIGHTLNPYLGCSYGCIYCESRGNCYNMIDFSKIRVKSDLPTILRQELLTKRKREILAVGFLCEAFGPEEQELNVTRDLLQSIANASFGVSIETKSDLIVRDIDKLIVIGSNNSAIVKVSFSAADEKLAHFLEPHAPSVAKRFAAVKELNEAGVFCGITIAPMLPFITDTADNIRELVTLAKSNGAQFVYSKYGISMRDGQREYFYKKIKALDRSLPKRYIETFGADYYCFSKNEAALRTLLHTLCNELDMLSDANEIMLASTRTANQKQSRLF